MYSLQLIKSHSVLFPESCTVLQGVLRPAAAAAVRARSLSNNASLCNDGDISVCAHKLSSGAHLPAPTLCNVVCKCLCQVLISHKDVLCLSDTPVHSLFCRELMVKGQVFIEKKMRGNRFKQGPEFTAALITVYPHYRHRSIQDSGDTSLTLIKMLFYNFRLI